MRSIQSQRRGLERMGDVSRKYRTAAPWELGRCRNWSDATGALPRSPAGADPSRGVRRTVLHGARHFVSPRASVDDGTLVSPRIDARSVDAERCRTDGRNEYRQQSRFAQPTHAAANFVPDVRPSLSLSRRVGSDDSPFGEREYFSSMPPSSSTDVPTALAVAVHEYRQRGDLGALLDHVKA